MKLVNEPTAEHCFDELFGRPNVAIFNLYNLYSISYSMFNFLFNIQLFIQCSTFYSTFNYIFKVQLFIQHSIVHSMFNFLFNIQLFIQSSTFYHLFNFLEPSFFWSVKKTRKLHMHNWQIVTGNMTNRWFPHFQRVEGEEKITKWRKIWEDCRTA